MEQGSGHTLKAFDQDVDELRATLGEMAGLAEQAIREAMRCLMQRDLQGASRVVAADARIDALEAEAERQVVQLIALRAPMGSDLREVIATLKAAALIERIGDYAKNIARRVEAVGASGRIQPLSLLPEMARIVAEMVANVLKAFFQRDEALAREVCERDRAVDDFYNSIFRALLTFMMENPHNIGECTHLLFVARNLERIGDHATNIAEMVYFAATGERLGERQKGVDPASTE